MTWSIIVPPTLQKQLSRAMLHCWWGLSQLSWDRAVCDCNLGKPTSPHRKSFTLGTSFVLGRISYERSTSCLNTSWVHTLRLKHWTWSTIVLPGFAINFHQHCYIIHEQKNIVRQGCDYNQEIYIRPSDLKGRMCFYKNCVLSPAWTQLNRIQSVKLLLSYVISNDRVWSRC